jgi:hypothetical protein
MTDTKIEPCIECGADIEMDPIYNDGLLVGHTTGYYCAECGDPLCEDCVNTGLPQYKYGDEDVREVCNKCHEHLRNPTTNVGHTSLVKLFHVTTKEQDDAALAELHAWEDSQFLSIVDAIVKGQECSQPKTN